MTDDHSVHVIDRVFATFMTVTYSWKMFALYFYARPTTFFIQLAAFSFALFSFMNSQDAQESKDPDGFVFWHNCWHMYPIISSIIESFDMLVLGEHYVEDVEKSTNELSKKTKSM